jgi:hypothetical protein
MDIYADARFSIALSRGKGEGNEFLAKNSIRERGRNNFPK